LPRPATQFSYRRNGVRLRILFGHASSTGCFILAHKHSRSFTLRRIF